ncbi:MAG: hypothetical protein UMU75_10855, partial [Halomonas sp.]|nr:hypothetical protein [Halomonas sp.]
MFYAWESHDRQGDPTVTSQPFLTDIQTIRERARQHIENGAVTEGYRADRENVIRLLGMLLELVRCHVGGETLRDMVKEDLIAERIAIDSYREIAAYFGEQDPTSRRIMEDILA